MKRRGFLSGMLAMAVAPLLQKQKKEEPTIVWTGTRIPRNVRKRSITEQAYMELQESDKRVKETTGKCEFSSLG